jgi:hypothetical protein
MAGKVGIAGRRLVWDETPRAWAGGAHSSELPRRRTARVAAAEGSPNAAPVLDDDDDDDEDIADDDGGKEPQSHRLRFMLFTDRNYRGLRLLEKDGGLAKRSERRSCWTSRMPIERLLCACANAALRIRVTMGGEELWEENAGRATRIRKSFVRNSHGFLFGGCGAGTSEL